MGRPGLLAISSLTTLSPSRVSSWFTSLPCSSLNIRIWQKPNKKCHDIRGKGANWFWENCGKCRYEWGLFFIIQIALIRSVNVTHCFDSQSRSVSNIQAFGNLELLPKHYFKLTTAGSGDLLTTNRVSRQNVCVGASNVSVFYVYESRCNLSDKGALIDTFGRLSPAGGHRAGLLTRHQLGCRLKHRVFV